MKRAILLLTLLALGCAAPLEEPSSEEPFVGSGDLRWWRVVPPRQDWAPVSSGATCFYTVEIGVLETRRSDLRRPREGMRLAGEPGLLEELKSEHRGLRGQSDGIYARATHDQPFSLLLLGREAEGIGRLRVEARAEPPLQGKAGAVRVGGALCLEPTGIRIPFEVLLPVEPEARLGTMALLIPEAAAEGIALVVCASRIDLRPGGRRFRLRADEEEGF